jgi:hypothetical protein
VRIRTVAEEQATNPSELASVATTAAVVVADVLAAVEV